MPARSRRPLSAARSRAISTVVIGGQEIAYLPISRLRFPEEYQREISESHLRKIEQGWDPLAIGVIVVSYRGGVYNVIDGMHRVSVARREGETMVVAQVHRGLTRDEEADLFIKLNNSRTVKPLDKFRAKVFRKDPAALKIQETLRRESFQVQFQSEGRPQNGFRKFQAVAVLEEVYQRFGIAILRSSLRVVRQAFMEVGNCEKATQDRFFLGIAMYLYVSDCDPEWLVNQLIGYEPKQILQVLDVPRFRQSEAVCDWIRDEFRGDALRVA